MFIPRSRAKVIRNRCVGRFYEIVFKLYRKQWQVGRFLEEWRRIESGAWRQAPAQREETSKVAAVESIERRPQLVRWIAIAAAALFLVVVAWVWRRQIGVSPEQSSQSAAPSVSPIDQKLRNEPSPTSTPAPTVRTMSSPRQTPAVKSQKRALEEDKKADKILEEERNRSQPQ
jgi:hypothetical protein